MPYIRHTAIRSRVYSQIRRHIQTAQSDSPVGGGYMQTGWRKRASQPKVLVTGAAGQVGLEIVP